MKKGNNGEIKSINGIRKVLKDEWWFLLFSSAMFLHHIYITIYYDNHVDLFVFVIPWLALIIFNIVRGRLWKDRIAVSLFLLLLWKFLRLSVRGPEAIWEYRNVFLTCAYAFFGCCGLGKAIRKEKIRSFLTLFCALWTISMTVLSGLGIFVAWNGGEILNLGNKAIMIKEQRLTMIYHWVEGGILSSISLVVAFVGLLLCRKKTLRILYIAAMLIIFLAGLLTATRTAYAITAIEAALIAGALAGGKRREGTGKTNKKPYRWGRFILAGGVTAVILMGVQMYTITAFNHLRETIRSNSGSVIAELSDVQGTDEIASESSSSENSRTEKIESRPVVGENGLDLTLNGRTETWRNVLETIKERPTILLWGRSMQDPMEPVNQYRESRGLFYVFHCHSTYLQTLFENGVPGMTLYLAVLMIFISKAARLFLADHIPFWQKVIPIPVLGCMIEGLVEVTTYANYGLPQMTIMYLFIGLTIALSEGETGIKQQGGCGRNLS